MPVTNRTFANPVSVFEGIGDGGGRFLYGNNLFRIGRQQHGEGAHAGVGVQHRFATGQLQRVAHQLHQSLGLGDVYLEEGRRGDPKLLAGHRLPIPFLSAGYRYFRVIQRGLDQVVAGYGGGADGQLRGLGGVALQLSKQVVDAIVHQHTSVDADEAAALAVYESQCPGGTPHGEAGMVAITVRFGRWDCLQNRWLVERADAFQGVAHDGGLDAELRLIVDVLPLASSALAKVAARRIHAVGRWLDNPGNLGGYVLTAAGDNFRFHCFAGDTAKDEDILVSIPGHRLAETTPGMQG